MIQLSYVATGKTVALTKWTFVGKIMSLLLNTLSIFSQETGKVVCYSHFFKNLFVVQFSRSVMSDSLQPHGLQHGRPSYPSPPPRVYTNSCPLSWWYHPSISSSVVPFSSCLQSLPASGSFQMSQFFTASGQSIGVSASASVLPMNIQDWFPLGWTGWISLLCKEIRSEQALRFLYSPTLISIHDYWKNHSFD